MNEIDLFSHTGDVRNKDDLTHIIERVEELEKLTWVNLSACNAFRSSLFGLDAVDVRVLVEVSSTIGHVLPRPVRIQAIAYSEDGRMTGLAEAFLYPEEYRGIRGLELKLPCRAEPARIKLFPSFA